MGVPMSAPCGADMESMQSMLKAREEQLVSAWSQTLKAGASAQQGMSDPVESASASSARISKNNPLHRAYKPENTVSLRGITDRRFDGQIRMFLDDVGYGFIKSEEFEKAWDGTGRPKNDVFIHRNQKGSFKVNDKVSFSVYLNFKGKPQGTDLQRYKPKEDADDD